MESSTPLEIYFDNNATTQPLPEVREVMLEVLGKKCIVDINLKIISQPGMNIGYLGFGLTKEPWKSNVHLRRAVAHAINRKAIVDNIYQGMGEVAKNCIPPTMWGYNTDVPGYKYDLELAKQELAKAGFPEAKGLDELTLWSMPVPRPYNPEGLKVGIAMIGDLAKIGITARIVSYDWGT